MEMRRLLTCLGKALLGRDGGLQAVSFSRHPAPSLCGARDDLVVDIGKVPDEVHVPSAEPKVSDEGIENDHRSSMSHMAPVVDRHSADIDTDLPRLYRLKIFDASRAGVVETERCGHGFSSGR